jgi:serine palmitoyltransferase
VGTCGPRGFYGTIDLHLELEQLIAEFLQVESAIIYSQASATISSVIPAYAKVGDILVVDSGCNFSIQKGVDLSRSLVFHFNHNDMSDLEKVLKDINRRFAKKDNSKTRRFIIVEGLYANYGDICPLPKIIELKEKYKYRLMIDESLSIGSMGPRGAGVSDYFNVPVTKLDFIMGSMAHHFGAGGGFCAGTHSIIDYQVLNGKAYCFSASLPACLANAARYAITYLQENHKIVLPKLQNNIDIMYAGLMTLSGFELETGPSPSMHLYLKSKKDSPLEEAQRLDQICSHVHALLADVKFIRISVYFILGTKSWHFSCSGEISGPL